LGSMSPSSRATAPGSMLASSAALSCTVHTTASMEQSQVRFVQLSLSNTSVSEHTSNWCTATTMVLCCLPDMVTQMWSCVNG
jgi:hypothetical protein